MSRISGIRHLAAFGALLSTSTAVHAVDITAGDWTFSFSGNVNAHYIHSQCDDTTEVVAGGLACNVGDGNDAKKGVSTVSNGLLPAAFTFGAATVQDGWDLAAHLGLYPGISANDGGRPNLQEPGGNTALATTGLDVRQVFMTFGNKQFGVFALGRNFGLFGFDAIINDMTLPGVGGAGAAASASPANTTLGSIGLGYIYVDELAQMNYTTPDFGGAKLTIGIYDPIEPIGEGAGTGSDSSPGFHGKVSWAMDTTVYLSATFIHQKNNVADADGGPNTDFSTNAFDVGGKFAMGPFEAMAWYYTGKGIGTTGLLVNPTDATSDERKSDGFLAQATFLIAKTKLGVQYGESNLDKASDEADSALVKKNSKYTVGAYHSLTKNLTLLAEFTDVQAKAHNGDQVDSSNFNVGAYLSF